jgi:hypothetical protein
VSLGYDVPRHSVEECLVRAAENAELTDPFVFVLELGDFSITYQIAGFLEEVKYLISAESKLRECMLDAFHEAGIEIVSPTFMNQRQLPEGRLFIPKDARPPSEKPAAEETRPEERMFDKAEVAESEAKAVEQLKAVVQEIEKIQKNEIKELSKEAAAARLEELQIARSKLEIEIEAHKEQKNEEPAEEGG